MRQKELNIMSIVSEAEFKGNPMLVIKITAEDKYPFQFGTKKAKLILENIENIKKLALPTFLWVKSSYSKTQKAL